MFPKNVVKIIIVVLACCSSRSTAARPCRLLRHEWHRWNTDACEDICVGLIQRVILSLNPFDKTAPGPCRELGEPCDDGLDGHCKDVSACAKETADRNSQYICCEDAFTVTDKGLPFYDVCKDLQSLGEQCSAGFDDQCDGPLVCAKETADRDSDYICCEDAFTVTDKGLPFYDVCENMIGDGKGCPYGFDAQCEGSLVCAKATESRSSPYQCCYGAYTAYDDGLPFYDVCLEKAFAGEQCTDGFDASCDGSLACAKKNANRDSDYICCNEAFTVTDKGLPFYDVCKNQATSGETCVDGFDEQCDGSLVCAKKNPNRDSDYICCNEAFTVTDKGLPFYDVCKKRIGNGQQCPHGFDDQCQDSLECAKANADRNSNYICCGNGVFTVTDKGLPYYDVCKKCIGNGQQCPHGFDDQCQGSLECAKANADRNSNYVCCGNGVFTVTDKGLPYYDVCKKRIGSGQQCPHGFDAQCQGTLECAKANADRNSNYICCGNGVFTITNRGLPYYDVCKGVVGRGGNCPYGWDRQCAGSLKCGWINSDTEYYVCCDSVHNEGGIFTPHEVCD